MKKEDLQSLVYYETDEETLLMDGFEDAFIGFSRRCGQPTLATYSFLKMLQIEDLFIPAILVLKKLKAITSTF